LGRVFEIDTLIQSHCQELFALLKSLPSGTSYCHLEQQIIATKKMFTTQNKGGVQEVSSL